ncbi:MAG: dual specificity protein phosphatase family protein [Bacteroidota bacterium]
MVLLKHHSLPWLIQQVLPGRTYFFAILWCSVLTSPFAGIAQNLPLEKVASPLFKRLYQLNDSVYRSEQPSSKGFRALETIGIKTALNFRRNKKDNRKAKGTAITLIHMPLKTSELTEQHLIEALAAIKKAEKPILVHCWHGSDRTGAIMAAYRVVFENWTKSDAIQELRKPELGYHEKWYPNVIDLITQLDTIHVKKALGL